MRWCGHRCRSPLPPAFLSRTSLRIFSATVIPLRASGSRNLGALAPQPVLEERRQDRSRARLDIRSMVALPLVCLPLSAPAPLLPPQVKRATRKLAGGYPTHGQTAVRHVVEAHKRGRCSVPMGTEALSHPPCVPPLLVQFRLNKHVTPLPVYPISGLQRPGRTAVLNAAEVLRLVLSPASAALVVCWMILNATARPSRPLPKPVGRLLAPGRRAISERAQHPVVEVHRLVQLRVLILSELTLQQVAAPPLLPLPVNPATHKAALGLPRSSPIARSHAAWVSRPAR